MKAIVFTLGRIIPELSQPPRVSTGAVSNSGMLPAFTTNFIYFVDKKTVHCVSIKQL